VTVPRLSIPLTAIALACVACDADDAPSLEPVIEEACLHATNGPYRDMPASTDLQGTVSDVDRPHTAYRVAVPSGVGGHLGAVRYAPRHDGLYAFLTDRDPAVEIRASDDRVVPLVEDTAIAGCSALSHVVTAELTADIPYRLILGPTTASDLLLVIENVDEFLP
jgi:hypothetical protein